MIEAYIMSRQKRNNNNNSSSSNKTNRIATTKFSFIKMIAVIIRLP